MSQKQHPILIQRRWAKLPLLADFVNLRIIFFDELACVLADMLSLSYAVSLRTIHALSPITELEPKGLSWFINWISTSGNIQLKVFVKTSQSAALAAMFSRPLPSNDNHRASFFIRRTNFAPSKSISIPGFEFSWVVWSAQISAVVNCEVRS